MSQTVLILDEVANVREHVRACLDGSDVLLIEVADGHRLIDALLAFRPSVMLFSANAMHAPGIDWLHRMHATPGLVLPWMIQLLDADAPWAEFADDRRRAPTRLHMPLQPRALLESLGLAAQMSHPLTRAAAQWRAELAKLRLTPGELVAATS